MTATIELNNALDTFIKYYHNNATKSRCWLRVYDHPSENLDDKRFIDPLTFLDTGARSLLENEQDKLRPLDKLYLRHQMGLDEDSYFNMMIVGTQQGTRLNLSGETTK